jgi:protein-tyrosine phosphatase
LATREEKTSNARQQQRAPIRLLFVCMGNICRSPIAEAVFRSLAQRSRPDLAVEADSAGTHGYHVGHAPDERAQRVARAHGIDISALRARQLVVEDFDRFDRILVMDLENQKAALSLAPSRLRHRVQLLLDYAPQLALREVPDPYYGELPDFERVFDLSEQAARGLLQSLAARATIDEHSP